MSASDIVNGIEKLNLAFVANLFNKYPGLDEPEGEIEEIQETREEKSMLAATPSWISIPFFFKIEIQAFQAQNHDF